MCNSVQAAINDVQSNMTEQQFKRQLAKQFNAHNINVNDIKAPSYNDFLNAVQKLTNSIQSWSTNNQEKVFEAIGIYTHTFGVNNMIGYCKPHYSMDKLTKVYNTQIISKREAAKNMVVKAGGSDLLKLYDDLFNDNSALLINSLNTDYLLAKKESEKQSVVPLTKEQYCKSLDDAADIVPNTIEKSVRQLLNQTRSYDNPKSKSVSYNKQPYADTTRTTRNTNFNRRGDAVIRGLSAGIAVILFFLIGSLRDSTRYVKKEIVEKQYNKHKNNQEKYRKYLRDCDKRGKTPLSYKQWKFAYTEKKGKK